jgi:hypothetical protein
MKNKSKGTAPQAEPQLLDDLITYTQRFEDLVTLINRVPDEFNVVVGLAGAMHEKFLAAMASQDDNIATSAADLYARVAECVLSIPGLADELAELTDPIDLRGDDHLFTPPSTGSI